MDHKEEHANIPTSSNLSTERAFPVTSEPTPRTVPPLQVSVRPPPFYPNAGYLPPPGAYMYPSYYPPPAGPHQQELYLQRFAQQPHYPDTFGGPPAGTRSTFQSSPTAHSPAPTGPPVFESPARYF